MDAYPFGEGPNMKRSTINAIIADDDEMIRHFGT